MDLCRLVFETLTTYVFDLKDVLATGNWRPYCECNEFDFHYDDMTTRRKRKFYKWSKDFDDRPHRRGGFFSRVKS